MNFESETQQDLELGEMDAENVVGGKVRAKRSASSGTPISRVGGASLVQENVPGPIVDPGDPCIDPAAVDPSPSA
jgi:hypothetical protein